MTGVYKITNIINGKVYVGESMDIDKRWDEHKLDLDNGVHHSYKLQEDWNTYDRDNFKFKVLEEIDDNLKIIIQKCLLYILEDKYIKQYNSINNGYNIEETLELILKGEKPIFEGMEIKKKQIFIMKNIINNIKINNGMYVSIDKTKRIKSTNNKNISLEYLYNNDNIKFIIDHCKIIYFKMNMKQCLKYLRKMDFIQKEYIKF